MIHPNQLAGWGLAGAVAIGFLTALLPCPLTTVAASVLLVVTPEAPAGRNLIRAGAFVAGSTTAYMLMAVGISCAAQTLPFFSVALPSLIRPFLAPFLILAGILLTGVFPATRTTHWSLFSDHTLNAHDWGSIGIFALGMAVSLAFCPATAGLFFGVLIPLGVAHQSPVMYAVCFGVGYGAPLEVIATSLAYGARLAFIRSHADKWTRLSGWVLIALGTLFMFRIT